MLPADLKQLKHVAGELTLNNDAGAHDPARCKLVGADDTVRVAFDCLDCQFAEESPSFFPDCAIGVKSQWNEDNTILFVLVVVLLVLSFLCCSCAGLRGCSAAVVFFGEWVGDRDIQSDGLTCAVKMRNEDVSALVILIRADGCQSLLVDHGCEPCFIDDLPQCVYHCLVTTVLL